jgi:hypothetical protein
MGQETKINFKGISKGLLSRHLSGSAEENDENTQPTFEPGIPRIHIYKVDGTPICSEQRR